MDNFIGEKLYRILYVREGATKIRGLRISPIRTRKRKISRFSPSGRKLLFIPPEMRNTRDSLGGSAIGSHESDQGGERDPGNILGPSQSGHIDSPLTMSGTLGELRTKTKVAFMILGASVLLPWNGELHTFSG
jgi:hypothetical protein